jgi:putative ABC transport system permease protein
MRRHPNDELNEEIAGHLQMAARERIDGGEDPESAAAAARRQFGNVTLVKEVTRATWNGGSLQRVLQDIRFGARLLRRNALYTAIAIFTLALGIGSTTAIYSVVYGVLLRPLPYFRPDRIVSLKETQPANPVNGANFTDPNFVDLRSQNRTLSALAEYQIWVDTVSVKVGQPERLGVARVSKDFLDVMGVAPRTGRRFAPDEERTGAARAALISDGYWRRAFAAAPALDGMRVRVGNDSYAVVGVLPPGFSFPEDAAVWVPRELDPVETSRTSHNFRVVGRLRDGVGLEAARSDLNTLARTSHERLREPVF